ncbi:unnamed protein product [Schistosoma turkestanicum]|nr:unnamed protein product [Schistosoma turkestanicum]
MNLSTINVTHSIESLSSSSSPELFNTSSTMISTNHPTINSNVLPSTIQMNTSLNENEFKSSANTSSSSSSSSSSILSNSMSNGMLSMNHFTNSLLLPTFSSNILLHESLNLIYHTCLNMFDKRFNEALNIVHQKYELLLSEYNETQFRLNKLEQILQLLLEEKYNLFNVPLMLNYLHSMPNSWKLPQHPESNDFHNNNNNTVFKNIHSKWLDHLKDYEMEANSLNGTHQNFAMSNPVSTTSNDHHSPQQTHHNLEKPPSQKLNMTNKSKEFSVNNLSSSSMHSTLINTDHVIQQNNMFNESFVNRLHHHFSGNLDPVSSSSSSSASSALTTHNQHFLWNQWMANMMASNNCINSANGLLPPSSTSSSSTTTHLTLNNSERIDNLTNATMESMEGNQVSYEK